MNHPNPGARSHHDHEDQAPLLTRRQLMFAGAAATATFGIWARSESGSPERVDLGSASSTTMPNISTTVTNTPSAGVTPPPTATPSFVPIDHDLAEGMVESKVETLQALLAEQRFDPGPIDGIFGGATKRAVWAFEKLVLGTPREEMQGIVTPDIWERMNSEFRVAPRRSPGGNHMEVYLPEQVSVLFFDGEARVISHVSSGEGITWCDEVEIDLDDGTTEVKGICGVSITPGGVYHFERKVEGWRNAKLGRLYKPVYFNYGIAIHGAGNVPAYPASRGCVRHPMHIAEYIQDLVSIGDAIYVFDGIEEPETYGAQPMIFDYPDPDWIPPTTTTTVPDTATTVPDTTTTAPDTTTSTTRPTTTTTTTTPTTVAATTSAPATGPRPAAAFIDA